MLKLFDELFSFNRRPINSNMRGVSTDENNELTRYRPNLLSTSRVSQMLIVFTNLHYQRIESLEPARDSHTRAFLIGFIVDGNI